MSFGIYALGFAIMICGLMYGAHLMHIPAHWIVVGGVVLLGVGILSRKKPRARKIRRSRYRPETDSCVFSGVTRRASSGDSSPAQARQVI